jgi:hypothetical protein
MNIFALSYNPKEAAQFHCDKHVVKMITEYNQLLSTTQSVHGLKCFTARQSQTKSVKRHTQLKV